MQRLALSPRYYWTHTQNKRESGEGGAVMPSTHLHPLKALPQRRGRFRSADSCLANTDTPLPSSSVSFHSSLSSCGWWENVPVEIHLVYCFFFQHWEWWGFVYTISLDILDKSPVYQSSTDCHIAKDMKFVHHIWPIPWRIWGAADVLAWESLCDLTSPSTNTLLWLAMCSPLFLPLQDSACQEQVPPSTGGTGTFVWQQGCCFLVTCSLLRLEHRIWEVVRAVLTGDQHSGQRLAKVFWTTRELWASGWNGSSLNRHNVRITLLSMLHP